MLRGPLKIDSQTLPPDEVHVLYARLEDFQQNAIGFFDVLARDEQERAARFHFERDRQRYITARGLLRSLLGGYCNVPPNAVRLAYGPWGKPQLDDAGKTGLSFNVSHAGSWVVYAVARHKALGVDVETLDDKLSWEKVAPSVFSSAERKELDTLAEPDKPMAFLRGWTRKEAYIKGRGQGLSLPLQTFDVPLRAEGGPWSVKTASQADGKPRWWLYPLEIAPGCAAALAVQGPPVRIKTIAFS